MNQPIEELKQKVKDARAEGIKVGREYEQLLRAGCGHTKACCPYGCCDCKNCSSSFQEGREKERSSLIKQLEEMKIEYKEPHQEGACGRCIDEGANSMLNHAILTLTSHKEG